jgi:hypothetical protein
MENSCIVPPSLPAHATHCAAELGFAILGPMTGGPESASRIVRC